MQSFLSHVLFRVNRRLERRYLHSIYLFYAMVWNKRAGSPPLLTATVYELRRSIIWGRSVWPNVAALSVRHLYHEGNWTIFQVKDHILSPESDDEPVMPCRYTSLYTNSSWKTSGILNPSSLCSDFSGCKTIFSWLSMRYFLALTNLLTEYL